MRKLLTNFCTSFLFSTIFLVSMQTQIFAQSEDDFGDLSLEDLLNVEINVASSKAEDIFSTPSTVSLIDADMIKEYNISSVAEAVNLVAGLDMTRTYLKRNLPTARGILQDHYANKVLIMINGIPSWHAGTGEGNLDRVNINDVKRIEVLKGPASVKYGTNAYSGAINIILKKYDESKSNLHFSSGERGLFSGGGNINIYNDNYSVFISGNSSTEKGHDYSFTDEKGSTGLVKEYMRSNNFNLSVGNSDHSLLFNAYEINESYLGVTPTFTGGAGKNNEVNGYLADYSFSHSFTENFEVIANTAYDWNRRNLSRSSDDSVRANVEGYRLFAGLKMIYSPAEALNIEFGGDYDARKSVAYDNVNPLADKVLEENNMKGKTASEYSFFGQAGYLFAPFNIVAGARYTDNQLFGNNISSRATLVFKLNDKNSVKLIYGTSYRAPSLFELYFATSSKTVFGNEDLKPEKSTSFEAAYLTSFDKFFIQIIGYTSDYTNKIFRTIRDVTLADGTLLTNKSVYDNGQGFKAKGIELEVKYRNPGVINGFINVRYIDGDKGDEINGNDTYNFKFVPKEVLSAGISRRIGSFNVSALMNYLGKTEGPVESIKSMTTFDLGVGFEHKVSNVKIHHNISAKNLTDEMVLVPEYVRRKSVNAISSGYGRRIAYSMNVEL